MSNKFVGKGLSKCQCGSRPGWEMHDCPNMKKDRDDYDMDYERYTCDVCGETAKLDYEEMR
jgi:hypothetical protein